MRTLLAVAAVLAVQPIVAVKAVAPSAKAAKAPKVDKSWFGMASWYGDHWDGRLTGCGKRFSSKELTVAHPTLPCGTWVRVTNVRTNHSEFAKVTDRGPYEEGREIDVSEAVARRIDLKRWGVEKVKIEIVRPAEE